MIEECFVKVKGELVDAQFIGVFQYSQVIEPSWMAGGHTGGVVAYPVAVVKIGNGLKEVRVKDVVFKNE